MRRQNPCHAPPPLSAGPPPPKNSPGFSTAGGRVLGGTKHAPLLVLARFRAMEQLTKNQSHRVTPFWHNDTHSRVTVTFGARRLGGKAWSENWPSSHEPR